jgi:hypothetical protein
MTEEIHVEGLARSGLDRRELLAHAFETEQGTRQRSDATRFAHCDG